MTIIVFLIDTSSSMNQRVFLGGRPTLLDVAKSAVETFVKVRQRCVESRQDRYMLLTFEDPPANIKAGWKENLGTFMSELKNLQANGLTTLGNALRHTFDVLNVNRMQHGIDTYGQGKCPFYLEPSIIVCITDGGQLSSNSGVQDELKMHGASPGCELTREPFRWDQRLFSLVLRMTGQPSGERESGLVPSDNSPIDVMCEVTGGRSYAITTHRMLHQCIDSLVQKVQAGVVVLFEKHGPDPPPMPVVEGVKAEEPEIEIAFSSEDMKGNNNNNGNGNGKQWQSVRRMIYVPRSTQKGFAGGFWPIPESYWPDPSLPGLPSRTAHPNVKFTCAPSEPLVVENFPFDKYELEPSPLTQYIISRKQPTSCWQVYIQNSSRSNPIGFPFGYLKASTNLTAVNLFVMPYNYPVLLPLVDELFRVHRLKPSNEWKAQFAMYLSSMPPYYAGPLKRALLRMGAGNIAQSIPEENYLSYSVLNYLKKLKALAKAEYDRTCNDVAIRVKSSETGKRIVVTSFKNPFDIPRHQLLDQVARLKTLFFRSSHSSAIQAESLHNIPVGQMGNYQEYLKRMPNPLRELDSTPVRQHMFGNPFKLDKRMMIDEADIDLISPQGKASKRESQNTSNNNNNREIPKTRGELKRKAGPIPKDFKFLPYKHRKKDEHMADYSPSPSPPMSPHHHTSTSFTEKWEKENVTTDDVIHAIFGDSGSVHPIADEVEEDEEFPMAMPFLNGGRPDRDEDNITPPSLDDIRPDNIPYTTPMETKEKEISNQNGIGPPSLPPNPNPSLQVPNQNHINHKDKPKSSRHKNRKPPSSPTTTTINTTPPIPSHLIDDETSSQKNLELRIDLFKEIRRPGLRMDYILSQLSNVSGSYSTRQNFIKGLSREALRFKRKRLSKALDEQADILAPFCRPTAS